MNKPLTVYKASAGSGKTFTLATEYIKLVVEDPQCYRNILAVTFTNKATEEMKMRILSQLYGIWKQLPDSEKYMQVICEKTGLSEALVSERAGIALDVARARCQLEGELGATALGQIYTFGPTFRAENSNTPRHLAEFWMIEPEVCFIDMEDLMDLEEDFIKYCVKWALDNCKDDLEFLNKMIDKGLIERLQSVIKEDFVRLPYTKGIEILQEAVKNGKKFEFPCNWGDDLASEHERYLVEEYFKKPVIMTNYPKAIKAFYMKIDEKKPIFNGKEMEETVQGTDVLFPAIGEIIGGSVREESYDKLINEIKSRDIPMKDMWWYLDTRKFGSCPHGGFGLGFERLILFVTGMQNIRDVIPFPRTPKTADF